MNKIFQRGLFVTEIVTFGVYTFELLESDPETDILYYEISSGPIFHLRFIIFGITSNPQCGPSSNQDLIEFIWHNSKKFNAIKYVMLLCPKSVTCRPRLLCMRYYRAISDGWRDDRGCPQCVEDDQLTMRDLTGCKAPGICHCKFCVRQPPSVRDLASHTPFKLKFDIPKLN